MLATTLPAFAQTGRATGPDKEPSTVKFGVDIAVVGTSSQLDWMMGIVESGPFPGGNPRWIHLTKLEPMEILRVIPEPRDVSVRCWVDLSDPKRARLYFATRTREQFLIRELDWSGRFDEVDRESMSQILELSVSALLENDRVGLSRAETEALLARTESPPRLHEPEFATLAEPSSSASGRWIDNASISASYDAQVASFDLPVSHGPGVSMAIMSADARWGAWTSGQYRFPLSTSAPAASMRIEGFATRIGFAYRPFASATSLGAEWEGRLGAGLDFNHVRPGPGTDASVVLVPSWWSRSLVVSAMVGPRWQRGRHWSVGVRAGVDVLPESVHYDVMNGAQADRVFSPWRLRPGMQVEIAARAW